ncbi:hypothetical protein MOQ_003201 [Trypanosoma cruzi marinkellei]|uniref:Uncharacterized protein n=1 Tax=Trypanosoma cruzi marinkellei TaxID=85056 RepID=K2NVF4_TRYCR|nr:hypothetical protein MOQ_003201 [Trypanosoma cruzi marinkellei]
MKKVSLHALFLLVLLGLPALLTRPANAKEANSAVVLLEELVHVLCALLLCHLAWCLGGGRHKTTNSRSTKACAVLSGRLHLLLGGLALLHVLMAHGEEHQFAHVRLQALDVDVHALLALVLAATIHTDANRRGKARVDAGSLQLLNGEATAQALLHVVTHRGAIHLRAQRLEWAWERLLRLQKTQAAAAQLLCRLVEENLHIALLGRARVPVFPLVHVGDRIISLRHYLDLLLYILVGGIYFVPPPQNERFLFCKHAKNNNNNNKTEKKGEKKLRIKKKGRGPHSHGGNTLKKIQPTWKEKTKKDMIPPAYEKQE